MLRRIIVVNDFPISENYINYPREVFERENSGYTSTGIAKFKNGDSAFIAEIVPLSNGDETLVISAHWLEEALKEIIDRRSSR